MFVCLDVPYVGGLFLFYHQSLSESEACFLHDTLRPASPPPLLL